MLPWLSILAELGRLAYGSRKVRVTSSAYAAFCDSGAGVQFGKVGKQVSRVTVIDRRSGRDLQYQVYPVFAVHIFALAVAATLRFVLLLIPEIQQGREMGVHFQD